jgi:hypothetical protein
VKYKTHEVDGDEEGWTEWIKPYMALYRLGCCDCGLVHDLKFKEEGGAVYFKARRNNHATGQKRRHKKFDKR